MTQATLNIRLDDEANTGHVQIEREGAAWVDSLVSTDAPNSRIELIAEIASRQIMALVNKSVDELRAEYLCGE